MNFFATAEAYNTISRKLVDIQNVISAKLNSLLKEKKYGNGILDWGHISICNPAEFYEAGFFNEIRKYYKKEKDLDLRLKIDYEAMLKADEQEVFGLVCESILRGVDIAEHELKINNFDFRAFRNDLTASFKKEGWL